EPAWCEELATEFGKGGVGIQLPQLAVNVRVDALEEPQRRARPPDEGGVECGEVAEQMPPELDQHSGARRTAGLGEAVDQVEELVELVPLRRYVVSPRAPSAAGRHLARGVGSEALGDEFEELCEDLATHHGVGVRRGPNIVHHRVHSTATRGS